MDVGPRDLKAREALQEHLELLPDVVRFGKAHQRRKQQVNFHSVPVPGRHGAHSVHTHDSTVVVASEQGESTKVFRRRHARRSNREICMNADEPQTYIT